MATAVRNKDTAVVYSSTVDIFAELCSIVITAAEYDTSSRQRQYSSSTRYICSRSIDNFNQIANDTFRTSRINTTIHTQTTRDTTARALYPGNNFLQYFLVREESTTKKKQRCHRLRLTVVAINSSPSTAASSWSVGAVLGCRGFLSPACLPAWWYIFTASRSVTRLDNTEIFVA